MSEAAHRVEAALGVSELGDPSVEVCIDDDSGERLGSLLQDVVQTSGAVGLQDACGVKASRQRHCSRLVGLASTACAWSAVASITSVTASCSPSGTSTA